MPGDADRGWSSMRTIVLLGAAAALAGAAFLGGLYLGNAFGIAGIKDYVKGLIDPAARDHTPPGTWKVVASNLHEVVIERIDLPPSERTGGAIEQAGAHLLFATPEGRLGYVGADDAPILLDLTVPMNNEGMRADPVAELPQFDMQYLRVADLLVLDAGPSRYRLLVSHHRYHDGCVDFRVSGVTLRASGERLDAVQQQLEPVFVASPCLGFRPDNGEFVFSGHQAGGRMIAYGDGQVLLTVGDHQFDGTHGMPEQMQRAGLPDERGFAMSPKVSLGKILLLDPDTGATEIFARGVRNPQGLLRDSEGGVWETEHGPQGGDELNLIERGYNYGWPEVTLGVNYGTTPWPFNPKQGRHAGYPMPRFAWIPSIGVSNLVQAGGEQFPLWQGDLLVSSLIGMSLFRLRLHEGHVIYVEDIDIGERIRDAIVLHDGRIALYADTPNAVLILRNGSGAGRTGLTADTPSQPQGRVEQAQAPGADVFQAHCGACHSLRGEARVGPPLDGVLGRQPGSIRGFAFSAALRDAEESWTRNRLADYVRAPEETHPGTRMAAVRLPEQQMQDLIDFLAAQQSASVSK